jgi:hypothetical protein
MTAPRLTLVLLGFSVAALGTLPRLAANLSRVENPLAPAILRDGSAADTPARPDVLGRDPRDLLLYDRLPPSPMDLRLRSVGIGRGVTGAR